MIDTKLVAVISTKDVTINGRTIKAGYIVGYMRAGSQAEAKTILATKKTVVLIKIILNFGNTLGLPLVVSEYGLQFVAELPTKDLVATSNLAVTKLGARMIDVKQLLNSSNLSNTYPIYEQPTNTKVVGTINVMHLTATQRYFTTGYVFYGANGTLWHNVTNADKSVNGWLLFDRRFNYADTWSDFTADVANVVIQQPLQAVRDTVETIQENAGTFKTLLGLGVLALIISTFRK